MTLRQQLARECEAVMVPPKLYWEYGIWWCACGQFNSIDHIYCIKCQTQGTFLIVDRKP